MRRLLDEAGPLPWSLLPGLTGQLHERVVSGELDIAAVTDTPPGLPNDPRLDWRALGTDEMVVVLPLGHPQAGKTPVRIEALASEVWAEDHEGSRWSRPATPSPWCRECSSRRYGPTSPPWA
jgi:DNA-binding transcriptional LysR family regulator